MATFGGWLRAARLAHGCTRGELAQAAGIALGTVRDYEQDRRAPSLANAGRLAKALGLDLHGLQECIDLDGVQPVPRADSRYSRLTFGRHRGKRLNEVPAGYLQWLFDQQATGLKRGQLAEIERLLIRHGPRRRNIEDQTEHHHEFSPAKASAPVTDPVLARARRDKAARQIKTPDPEFFG